MTNKIYKSLLLWYSDFQRFPSKSILLMPHLFKSLTTTWILVTAWKPYWHHSIAMVLINLLLLVIYNHDYLLIFSPCRIFRDSGRTSIQFCLLFARTWYVHASILYNYFQYAHIPSLYMVKGHCVCKQHTVGWVLIAQFNDCVLVKSGQIANPIIVMDDPVPYCSIRACLCLRIY